jgi:3D (Asp-Asp-Asp) domain-containing protein
MKKYIISLLLIILMVAIGVNQVNTKYQTDVIKAENENENINKVVDKQEEITYNEINLESESKQNLNPEQNINIEENDNYIIMIATAYTKSIEEGTHKGITRSGTQVSRGTVAVDPRVIPLGTKLYVENYGHAVALDTGGAIKENRIDLYMETKDEAFEFGRKEVRVWIIE